MHYNIETVYHSAIYKLISKGRPHIEFTSTYMEVECITGSAVWKSLQVAKKAGYLQHVEKVQHAVENSFLTQNSIPFIGSSLR